MKSTNIDSRGISVDGRGGSIDSRSFSVDGRGSDLSSGVSRRNRSSNDTQSVEESQNH